MIWRDEIEIQFDCRTCALNYSVVLCIMTAELGNAGSYENRPEQTP